MYWLIIHHLTWIRYKTSILPSNLSLVISSEKAPNLKTLAMARGLPVRMTNSSAGIWLFQWSGVKLHTPHVSNRLDHSSQSLLKSLISHSVSKYQFLSTIFSSRSSLILHVLQIKNIITNSFVSLYSTVIIISALHETATISPLWWYSTCFSD